MSLLLQGIVIGFLVLMCAEARVVGDRKRRQSFFSFPDDYDNQGGFENPFFSNRFQEQQSNQNQFGPQQGPMNNQFFSRPGRAPFPTPVLPGPPAIINSPQPTSTVIPDTMVTTPSPGFFACMQNCPTTSEYNPICGTNRQLYFNQQKFECAKKCGARAEIWRRGSCEGLFAMMRG